MNKVFLPSLGEARQGKVRDIYDCGDEMVIVTTDRLSVFNQILDKTVPNKGRVLTGISKFWFDQTKDIVENHLLDVPHPSVMVVKKCEPIPVEVIMRGYATGSLWRDYEAGMRVKCGVALPEGMQEGAEFSPPILTPTRKTENDEDITEEEILSEGLVSEEIWNQIKDVSMKLFLRGQKIAAEHGMTLVDTKYEFGLDEEGKLVLIDEIHTPDSSRFWYQDSKKQSQVMYPDKEFVRQWVLKRQEETGEENPSLSDSLITEVQKRYEDLHKQITGYSVDDRTGSVAEGLRDAGVIVGAFALILSGSEKDQSHVDKILAVFEEHNLPYHAVVASAHKQTKAVLALLEQYEDSAEPVVIITCAGRSNALSGVAAANSRWPVIACPPFKDASDYAVNIHSSLQMPSDTPVLTVIDPKNAGLAALRILQSHR